jgi:hypothetical protein
MSCSAFSCIIKVIVLLAVNVARIGEVAEFGKLLLHFLAVVDLYFVA